MGLAYFQISNDDYEALADQIAVHEADQTGPRARGYWLDSDGEFDYEQSRQVAHDLFEVGSRRALDQLILSENEAHSLSMLDLELPADGQPIPPSLFTVSAAPAMIRAQLKVARRKLGPSAEIALTRIEAPARDPRLTGYLHKQLHHLNDALPKVWSFYQRAADAGQSVLVVDLRARDLEVPDDVELEALWAN